MANRGRGQTRTSGPECLCEKSVRSRIMKHGTSTLRYRPDRRPIRAGRAPSTPTQEDGPAPGGPARRPGRHPLPGPHRLPVAALAPRLPTLFAPSTPGTAAGGATAPGRRSTRRCGRRSAARPAEIPARAQGPPTARRSRPRPRAGPRASTTARRSRVASDTSGWTAWACCWPCW